MRVNDVVLRVITIHSGVMSKNVKSLNTEPQSAKYHARRKRVNARIAAGEDFHRLWYMKDEKHSAVCKMVAERYNGKTRKVERILPLLRFSRLSFSNGIGSS